MCLISASDYHHYYACSDYYTYKLKGVHNVFKAGAGVVVFRAVRHAALRSHYNSSAPMERYRRVELYDTEPTARTQKADIRGEGAPACGIEARELKWQPGRSVERAAHAMYSCSWVVLHALTYGGHTLTWTASSERQISAHSTL